MAKKVKTKGKGVGVPTALGSFKKGVMPKGMWHDNTPVTHTAHKLITAAANRKPSWGGGTQPHEKRMAAHTSAVHKELYDPKSAPFNDPLSKKLVEQAAKGRRTPSYGGVQGNKPVAPKSSKMGTDTRGVTTRLVSG